MYMLWKLGIFYDEEVQRLIDSFAKCFKVRFTIFSANYEDMILGFPYEVSPFCKMVREDLHLLPACLNQNRRMCRRCEQERKPLPYRCHAGLHEVVMPLTVNQKLIGYAMIGQFRVDTGALADLALRAGKPDLDGAALERAYLDLPLYDKELTANMVNLFSVLVNFIVMREYINIHQPGLAEKISSWLDDHLTEPVTLDAAAAAVGRGSSTVSHVIKRHFGMTFKQLHTFKRILRFEQLITSSPEQTIAEAAFKAGYEDPLYFSRIYKKTRHISPSVYVKDALGNG